MKKDIQTLDDIKLLVNSFYAKVRKDDLIGPIFIEKIQDRWPAHLEKMYTFWQTVLLEANTYYGSPFIPHAKLPVEKAHFDRWLKLFYETMDELFDGKKAERAKWQGDRMATMFQSKLEYYKNNPAIPII